MSVLYLDMDGVLADFDTAATARGVINVESYIHLEKEHWSDDQIEHDKQLRVCMNDDDFWASIPPFKNVVQFYDAILRLSPYKVKILTALPKNHARAQPVAVIKKVWLWKNLHVHPHDVITCLRSEKKKYADATSLLIDDNSGNCAEFIAAGGKAILHTKMFNTIQEVRKLYGR